VPERGNKPSYCSRSTIGFPRQPPNFSVTRPNVSGASWSARRHALSEAGCLCPRSAVRSRPGGMTGRERAARTRTSTALRRIAVLSGERRAIIIRSARRDVCARVCRPLPSQVWAKDENGRQGRAFALRPQKRPRLPFAANLLFFHATPRQARWKGEEGVFGQARGMPPAPFHRGMDRERVALDACRVGEEPHAPCVADCGPQRRLIVMRPGKRPRLLFWANLL
jgi:hypothetical protein